MPKVIFDKRGLVQETGSDVEVKVKGVPCVMVGDVMSLGAANDYDTTFLVPAGAILVDLGIRCVTALKTANTGGTDQLLLNLGVSAGGTPYSDIVGATVILDQNKTGVINSSQTISAGNKLEAAGSVLAFADDAAIYSASPRTVIARTRVMNTTLVTAGTAQVFLTYVIL